MIDVECVNSVSNRSKDIISLIIKVCRCFFAQQHNIHLLDLFTFTESINKHKPLLNLSQKIIICAWGKGIL